MTIETKLTKSYSITCKLNGQRGCKKDIVEFAAWNALCGKNPETLTITNEHGDSFTYKARRHENGKTFAIFANDNGEYFTITIIVGSARNDTKDTDIVEAAIYQIANRTYRIVGTLKPETETVNVETAEAETANVETLEVEFVNGIETTTSYKELLAQREAARVAADEIKALPELTGTEKQVNWALDIRAKKFANLNDMLADMNAKTTDEQMRRQNQIALQAAKNVLASKTDSRFWIDNRNVEARKLIADNNLQDDLKAEFARLTAAEENIAETDGSEDDDFADEMPALFPAEDTDDDDELIDPPSKRYDGYIGDEQVHYWNGELVYITSPQYGVGMNLHPEAIKILGKYFVQIPDGKWCKFVRPDENTFWQMMIERGACVIGDEPPTNDKDTTPDEMLAIVDTLDTVNAAAPYGWQLNYDGKGFSVEFNGKVITTLDSLALTKVLPPEQFFDQFNPDVPPKERYLNDLHKELDTLLDFRKFVEDDPDRLKTLTNLIEDVKREILNAELDTEHPPDIEVDENGDVIPWF